MGDIADALTEEGETAWFLHLAGDCDDWCQYCYVEGEIEGTQED